MKKYLLLYTALCCLFIACSTSSGKQRKAAPDIMDIRIPETLKVSPSFNIFCRDLSMDYDKASTPDKYSPSNELQKKYSLQQIDKQFVARGYMHVNQSFNEEPFKNYGGISTVYTDSVRSFSIPVGQLAKMLQIPGITYIELATKVKLIKY